MLSTRRAAIVIFCMLVIVLFVTGCTKGTIKSTTTYNLNRETNRLKVRSPMMIQIRMRLPRLPFRAPLSEV
jgi:hypothetical protein